MWVSCAVAVAFTDGSAASCQDDLVGWAGGAATCQLQSDSRSEVRLPHTVCWLMPSSRKSMYYPCTVLQDSLDILAVAASAICSTKLPAFWAVLAAVAA